MLKKTSMLLAAGAFMALASSAQAITPAPLGAPSDVITVAGGCGPGWYRGAYGRCRPMAARPVVCTRVMTAYGWRRVCQIGRAPV